MDEVEEPSLLKSPYSEHDDHMIIWAFSLGTGLTHYSLSLSLFWEKFIFLFGVLFSVAQHGVLSHLYFSFHPCLCALCLGHFLVTDSAHQGVEDYGKVSPTHVLRPEALGTLVALPPSF